MEYESLITAFIILQARFVLTLTRKGCNQKSNLVFNKYNLHTIQIKYLKYKFRYRYLDIFMGTLKNRSFKKRGQRWDARNS